MKLFPKELIEYSAENHFARHSVTSKLIYNLTVSLITIAALLLPVLDINVGMRGMGLVTPAQDRAEIVSFVSGRVSEVLVQENESVKKGDVIARVDAGERASKLGTFRENVSRTEMYLDDLSILSDIGSLDATSEPELLSNRYRLSYASFLNRVNDLNAAINLKQQIYDRNRELFKRDLISREKYESVSHSLNQSENEKRRLIAEQQTRWSEQRVELEISLEELEIEISSLLNEIERYSIRAPVNGTVTQLFSLFEGGTVFPQQSLGEISPDTTLIAEIYIPPSDIGYIRTGMQVHLRIDAFNSNEWGAIQGAVTSVSSDAIMKTESPYFIVNTTLNRTYLELPSGFRGEIKKGMTLQARFLLAKRSLFQLLFDSVDDWLNPLWSPEEAS